MYVFAGVRAPAREAFMPFNGFFSEPAYRLFEQQDGHTRAALIGAVTEALPPSPAPTRALVNPPPS
jgi:hypothetical protein